MSCGSTFSILYHIVIVFGFLCFYSLNNSCSTVKIINVLTILNLTKILNSKKLKLECTCVSNTNLIGIMYAINKCTYYFFKSLLNINDYRIQLCNFFFLIMASDL